jgi:hypothetical protein
VKFSKITETDKLSEFEVTKKEDYLNLCEYNLINNDNNINFPIIVPFSTIIPSTCVNNKYKN